MTEDPHYGAPLYVLDALDPAESAQFIEHLATCESCRVEVSELSEVAGRLPAAVEAEPPATLRAAVLTRIASTPHVAAPPEPRSAALDGSGTTVATTEPPPTEPAVARRWLRPSYLLTAAAVVLALVFGGWALQSRHSADEIAADRAAMVQLLAASDVRTVTGTGPPGTTATVVYSRQAGRAMFVAHHMPAPPSGKVYELWTIARTPAPAGTFRPTGEPVYVFLPRRAVTASAVAVTVERAGGVSRPTGRPVMQVSLSAR